MNRLNQNRQSGLRRQKGVSLLEVLIAVMVLSVGLLGVAGLQTTNLKNTQSAHQRTTAVLLASAMGERIRANRTLALTGVFALAKTCGTKAAGATIESVEFANWLNDMRLNLGTSATTCGEISYNAATTTYTVNVIWDDSRALGGISNMTIVNLVRL